MTSAGTTNAPGADPAPSLVERVTALYHDYAWAVDDQDYDALRGLLIPDVRLTANDWEAEGVDDFIATYQRLLAGLAGPCRHLISNVRANRSADGVIQTGAYFQAVFHAESAVRIQTGRYRDVHVETPAGLRIIHKRIEIDPTHTLKSLT
ncbi:nuclear transport factor 2 family protein [Nocardioides houyundeii]|uniref:nuclear transport factor 2 family protein n=1 Tax=Nocardioides houyundeii TaxID=2045452 RepID=UPI000C792B9C|nr:nuclear transport factor 2 family protein [Nocardioides houyundeii]